MSDNAKRGLLGTLERLFVHPGYILAVILFIQPINGALIARGQVLFGLAFIAVQVPWVMRTAFRVHDAEIAITN